MTKINLDTERCKACALCIDSCPRDALCFSGLINSEGYEYVAVDVEKCVGCGCCYQICPDYVFELLEE